jgi:hypothetical protein
MKKVALLFFGQPRFLNNPQVYWSYKKLIDSFDCTAFCHTWISKDPYETSTWTGLESIPVDDDAIRKINFLYKPVRLAADDPVIFDFKNNNVTKEAEKYLGENFNEKNFTNTLSQHYSISAVTSLVYPESIKNMFDVFVYCRFDMIFENVYEYLKANHIDDDMIVIPNNHRNFPDTVMLAGKETLYSFKYLYGDCLGCDALEFDMMAEVTAESFKKLFLSDHGNKIVPSNIYGHVVRNNG